MAQIGVGGMGEVYRARDTKLNREVALKILPDSVAGDPDHLTRFQREAELLAALNHPHIAQIYGLEDADSARALVMELVEGEDLAQRLVRGPLSFGDALHVALQMAEALEAAHEQGIVHRDLKPANIKLRPDGTVKVLDFGLAKAVDRRGASPVDPTLSPTMVSPVTLQATILGTAAYMAPEQAKGKAVDKRADIWAFGIVFSEMLSGRPMYPGETASEILAAVIMKPPDLAALPTSTPAAVRRLIERCLERDPRSRLRDIGEARITIEQYLENPSVASSVTALPLRRGATLLWLVSATVVVTAAIVLVAFRLAYRGDTSVSRVVTLSLMPPENASFDSIIVSPDGRYVAYTATDRDGRSRLWLRSMDKDVAKALVGTDDAGFPFWSPDSRHVAFNANGELKIVGVSDGLVETVVRTGGSRGGSWSPSGVIIGSTATGPLFKTSVGAGATEPLTRVDESQDEVSHRWPSFLPDGRHFLYTIRSGKSGVAGVYVGDLNGSLRRRLLPDVTNAVFAATGSAGGYVLFARTSKLMAQSFDANRLELGGEPVVLVDKIAFAEGFSFGAYSTSQNGTLVYSSALPNQNTELAWFDRSGRRLGTVQSACNRPTLSPDNRRIVSDCVDSLSGKRKVWVQDLDRGVRWLLGPGAFPVWSPDGRRVIAGTSDVGIKDIVEYDATGGGAPRAVARGSNGEPNAWSPDGRFVLMHNSSRFSLLLSADGGSGPTLDYRASSTRLGTFSPDGQLIAYDSAESGRGEIVVEQFDPDRSVIIHRQRWQVSSAGGVLARWRADGRELFFLSPQEQQIKSVAIGRAGKTIEPRAPATLFSVRLSQTLQPEFDVTSDGQRFLVQVLGSAQERLSATVVLNWPRLLH
jgi:serine/threonine protein kinase/Tol biopolymer transport system component